MEQILIHVDRLMYRIIKNDCRGFNNLSYTILLREEYVVAPMDQEILRVFMMCGVQYPGTEGTNQNRH